MYKTLAPGCIGHGEVRFVDAAEFTAACGFEGYYFDLDKDMEAGVEKTLSLLKRYNLKPAGFGLPVEYRADEETYKKGMEALPAKLDFAKSIGLRRCVTWIIPAHDELSFEENFARHADRLRPAAQMLKDRGMIFGLEFLGPEKLRKGKKHAFIHDLDGMLGLIEAIGTGNLGIMMDAWHWDMAGQKFEDFDKFKKPDDVVMAHIMDAPANVPACEQEDLVRRLPGTTGIINIEAYFAGLDKLGYEGPVLVEPFEAFLSKIPFERAVKIAKQAMDRVWPSYL